MCTCQTAISSTLNAVWSKPPVPAPDLCVCDGVCRGQCVYLSWRNRGTSNTSYLKWFYVKSKRKRRCEKARAHFVPLEGAGLTHTDSSCLQHCKVQKATRFEVGSMLSLCVSLSHSNKPQRFTIRWSRTELAFMLLLAVLNDLSQYYWVSLKSV